MDTILGICEWNRDRGLKEFNGGLEFDMMNEELEEFAWAFIATIRNKFGELNKEEADAKREEVEAYTKGRDFKVDLKVNQLDALGDLVFVAIGAMYKLTGSVDQVRDILLAITAANNLKGNKKDSKGKIAKAKDFKGPEDMIKDIISRGV